MPVQKQLVKEPPVVPKVYGGQWIAWNSDCTAIIGHGISLEEAEAQAQMAGEQAPAFEWVPPANRRIVGGKP